MLTSNNRLLVNHTNYKYNSFDFIFTLYIGGGYNWLKPWNQIYIMKTPAQIFVSGGDSTWSTGLVKLSLSLSNCMLNQVMQLW